MLQALPRHSEKSPTDRSRPFDDPIPLRGRAALTTLRQAGERLAARGDYDGVGDGGWRSAFQLKRLRAFT
jgi:hypothetical protein